MFFLFFAGEGGGAQSGGVYSPIVPSPVPVPYGGAPYSQGGEAVGYRNPTNAMPGPDPSMGAPQAELEDPFASYAPPRYEQRQGNV